MRIEGFSWRSWRETESLSRRDAKAAKKNRTKFNGPVFAIFASWRENGVASVQFPCDATARLSCFRMRSIDSRKNGRRIATNSKSVPAMAMFRTVFGFDFHPAGTALSSTWTVGLSLGSSALPLRGGSSQRASGAMGMRRRWTGSVPRPRA